MRPRDDRDHRVAARSRRRRLIVIADGQPGPKTEATEWSHLPARALFEMPMSPIRTHINDPEANTLDKRIKDNAAIAFGCGLGVSGVRVLPFVAF